MSEAVIPITPVRRSIKVSASAPRAYELFTRDFGSWWPLETHSIGLEGARSVTFGAAVGDDIVEITHDGSKEVWGTVLEWDPPHRVAFSWHPGRSAAAVTHVKVTFVAGADGATDVELVHSGWENWADGETQAVGYREGWIPVLESYADNAKGVSL